MQERVIKWWKADYWFLDNSYEIQVLSGGISYPSVTHAFLAEQSDNVSIRLKIAQTSVVNLKELANKEIVKPYDGFKGPDVMRKLLEYKFGVSSWIAGMTLDQTKVAQKLIATGTSTLVYGNNSCNQFWGWCNCSEHFNKRGQNVLGGLIMGVREKLIKELTKNVDMFQTCGCENPAESFYMYATDGKIWLKPTCEKCQAKVGVFVANIASDHSTFRFEKRWVQTREPVNKIQVSNQHSTIRPDVFKRYPDDFETIEEWEARIGWQGYRSEPTKLQPKLPQNITFYLSGRI